MAVNITLTSSMRSNLYALKNLTTQMNTTQMRLATGLKVNTAIDNASSYYQARALNNRASDLDALLDSMGQSIQTINTAIKGLEKSGEMLEQAAVIAEQAYEAAIIPEKAWFEAQVGPNGAVVSTAQELKDAIAANKETICVYGHIDLGEITSSVTLKDGQKLVGIGYFGNFDSEADKWSAISGVIGQSGSNDMITTNDSFISDLTIKTTSSKIGGVMVITSQGKSTFNNIDICIDNQRTSASNYDFIGINAMELVKISGKSIVRTTDTANSRSMLLRGNSNYGKEGFEVTDNSKLSLFNGYFNIYIAKIKIGENAEVYSSYSNHSSLYGAHIILQSDSSKFIVKSGTMSSSTGIAMHEGAEFIRGNMLYKAKESFDEVAMFASGSYSEEFLSKVNSYSKDMDYSSYDYINTHSASKDSFAVLNKAAEQYGTMMNSFDEIVEESSYHGVNLLTGGAMTTIFNENRDHSFVVQGEDMRANSLGITMREWNTREDIAASIKEIKAAMSKVRDMVESLGNNLSIIQTRENFTDKLIDVLQTGADDLVLADMNEESANYLALQTRNNLAVNALALAAQSGNAVLKLF